MNTETSPSGASASPLPAKNAASGERLRMAIILALALVHGLLYVFLVPPWQHYDEPAHFEYVWLKGHGKELTWEGDQGFRKTVLRSMIANDFYRGSQPPNPNAPGLVFLGFSQNTDRKLYYQAAGVVARALDDKPIEMQLRGVRLFSLLLYLLTIAAAYAATRAITQPGSALRWMTPAMLALLPGFTDLMTAVTDDVIGIFTFTVFLWAASLLITRGLSGRRLAFALFATALAVFAKIIGAITVPLLLVALVFAACRARWRWVPWAVLGMGCVAAFVITFRWGDVALWLRETNQTANTQCAAPDCAAVIGQNAFRITGLPGEPPPDVMQLLPGNLASPAGSRVYTLGAWMWACPGDVGSCPADPAQKFEADAPAIRESATEKIINTELAISSQPQFYAFTFTLPAKTAAYTLKLAPLNKMTGRAITFFYDGVVLAEGVYPAANPPVFDDASASEGAWDGRRFANLVRNASAESTWPTIRHTINTPGTRYGSYNPPRAILWSLLDPRGSWYYALTLEQILKTFWAKFGWGHVPLLWEWVYPLLAVFTGLGLVGGVFAAARAAKKSGGVLALMGLAFVVMWALAITRGAYISLAVNPWIPVARYGLPVILPTVLLLTAGWREWARLPLPLFARFRAQNPSIKYLIFFGLFLALAVAGLVSVVTFYAR
ncbi:MAG TPA: DUF2142 domain-containing protein [Thermoflexales bacterium]|nr:DUF2142 domain-containing protein [Thermoflexales bacterium]